MKHYMQEGEGGGKPQIDEKSTERLMGTLCFPLIIKFNISAPALEIINHI